MDKKMTFDEAKEKVKVFCEEREWDQFHNAKDLAVLISTEASELLQIFRFKNEKETAAVMESERRKDVEDEVADVLYGLLRFSQMNNIDLSDALERKIQKNTIKYPINQVKGKNLKYSEYERAEE